MITAWIIIVLYFLALVVIFIYALMQLSLLYNYLKYKNRPVMPSPTMAVFDSAPFVTIQLPIYNEKYVVERLLQNIARLQYPSDRLEIQVLDDSTDGSQETTAALVKDLQREGLNISHIRRDDRSGFKAGALKHGLDLAKGELIAVFDADFLPQPDWLLRTVPHFNDADIGVVQTKWGHINRDFSLLTRVQAFALDVHFTIEQTGRNSKGHFINFNGTAGIWRKACIIDAGNWDADTLTEDLDLSYRAQLKQWKFKYLEEVETPAELPVVISAARTQQFRWNKGGAENFRKMARRLLASDRVRRSTKIHGLLHLFNSSMFLMVLLVAVLSVPMLFIKNRYPELDLVFYASGFFISSTLIFFVSYWFMYKQHHGSGWRSFLIYIPTFVTFFTIAMGFSLHNTIAVVEGYLGKKSAFIRTPKFNVQSLTDQWRKNMYVRKALPQHLLFEIGLMIYFGFGIVSAFYVGQEAVDFGMFPFHLMLFAGFGYVVFHSIANRLT